MKKWFKPRLDWLLVFVPVAAVLEFFAPEAHEGRKGDAGSKATCLLFRRGLVSNYA